MTTKTLLPIFTLLVMGFVTAHAEDAYPGDAAFINQAAIHGRFEVDAGKLAMKNALSDDVRLFGAEMVLDHSKLNDQLKMIAKNKEWTLPDTLSTRYQTLIEEFGELNRKDFDRVYSTEMARIHKMDRESFDNAAKFAADPDLKAWARQVEALIDQHSGHVPELRQVETTITIKK